MLERFNPQAKKALELALREALSLGHNYIGTEHILLGIARQRECLGARILLDFGADSRTLLDRVMAGTTPEKTRRVTADPHSLRVEIIHMAAATLRDAAVILDTAAQALEDSPQ